MLLGRNLTPVASMTGVGIRQTWFQWIPTQILFLCNIFCASVFPHIFVWGSCSWLYYPIVRRPPPPPPRQTLLFCTLLFHTLHCHTHTQHYHTQHCHTHLSHIHLSRTHTHTQLCHTHNFVIHLPRTHLSHTQLSHTTSTDIQLNHTHTTLSHTTLSHIYLTHRQLSHTTFTHSFHSHLWHRTLSHTHTTLSHLPHTHLFISHTHNFHTKLSHTSLLHTTCHTHTHHLSHTSLPLTHTHLFHTQLSHHLSHTTLSHTHTHLCHTPSFTHISLTYNLVTHTHLCHTQLSHTSMFPLCGRRGLYAWQARHLATSTSLLRARRGTYRHYRLDLVTHRDGRPGRRGTLRGKRGTWRHPRSFCVASVALGNIPGAFAWQAWLLRHWAGSGGALGPGSHFVWHAFPGSHGTSALGWLWWRAESALVAQGAAARCVAGAGLGDVHVSFMWQAALGDIPAAFAWQPWHLLTSTLLLRGMRGKWHLWHRAGSGGALGRCGATALLHGRCGTVRGCPRVVCCLLTCCLLARSLGSGSAWLQVFAPHHFGLRALARFSLSRAKMPACRQSHIGYIVEVWCSCCHPWVWMKPH